MYDQCSLLLFVRRRRRVSLSCDAFVVLFVEFCSLWSLQDLFVLVILGPTAFFLAVWVLLSWWLGGQVRGPVGCYNLGSFLVELTSVDSFWLFSLRIVLPLELEIRFG